MEVFGTVNINTTLKEKRKFSLALDRLGFTDDQLKDIQQSLHQLLYGTKYDRLAQSYQHIHTNYESLQPHHYSYGTFQRNRVPDVEISEVQPLSKYQGWVQDSPTVTDRYQDSRLNQYTNHYPFVLDKPAYESEDTRRLSEQLEQEFSARKFDTAHEFFHAQLDKYCMVPMQTLEDVAATAFDDIHGYFELAVMQAVVASTRQSIHEKIRFYKSKIRIGRLAQKINTFFIDKSRILKTKIKQRITRIDAQSDDTDSNEYGLLHLHFILNFNINRHEKHRYTYNHQ